MLEFGPESDDLDEKDGEQYPSPEQADDSRQSDVAGSVWRSEKVRDAGSKPIEVGGIWGAWMVVGRRLAGAADGMVYAVEKYAL